MWNHKNPERTAAIIWLWVGLVSTIAFFLPFISGMDMMKIGYGLSLLAFFAAITSVIVTYFFWKRAKALDRLLHSEGLLAHWTYTPIEWQSFIDLNFNKETQEKRVLFMVIAGFSILIGLFFLIFVQDGGAFVFLVMLGLIIILSFFAFILPRLNYQQKKFHPGEAYISLEGVYFNRNFLRWNSWGTRLENVKLTNPKKSLVSILEFRGSTPAGIVMQSYTLLVPVPGGQDSEAKKIVEVMTTGVSPSS